MEENSNPLNSQQQISDQQSKKDPKDGLMPGQKEEDELNLLGDFIFKLAGFWIDKVKNLFQHK